MNLSEHFTLAEMTKSATATTFGLRNAPSPNHVENLRSLCVDVLEPLRVMWGSPIIVTSGYRSSEVNAKIGGARTSQHMAGEAADIVPKNGDTRGLFDMMLSSGLPFDQLINEHPNEDDAPSWIHISYTTHRKNRRQVLTIG